MRTKNKEKRKEKREKRENVIPTERPKERRGISKCAVIKENSE